MATAGDDRGDTASAHQAPVCVVVVATVGVDAPWRCSGRPCRPRIAGMASMSGMSWVTSWRLPPVRVTARGTPPASLIRWCLLPGRPRSTGLGPTLAPL